MLLPSAVPQALPASASHSDSEAEEPDSEGTQRPGADSEEGPPGALQVGCSKHWQPAAVTASEPLNSDSESVRLNFTAAGSPGRPGPSGSPSGF